MRAGDDLDAHDGADVRSRGGTGISGGLYSGDIAPEEHGHVTTADLFPAGDVDIGGLERGIGGLNGGAETFAFDHSNSLL